MNDPHGRVLKNEYVRRKNYAVHEPYD